MLSNLIIDPLFLGMDPVLGYASSATGVLDSLMIDLEVANDF